MAVLDHNTEYLYILRAEFSDAEQEAAWNQWYEEKHIPELLTVPGFASATRYRERGEGRRYLAIYEITGTDVFDEPRYAEVTGWGDWEPFIVEWKRAVYRLEDRLDTAGTS